MGDSNEKDPYFKERRASTRIKKHGHLDVRHKGNNELIRSQIMNISEGGIRFISQIAFELGERIELRLKGEEVFAIVLECKNLYNGYAVRAEFEQPEY